MQYGRLEMIAYLSLLYSLLEEISFHNFDSLSFMNWC